MAASGDWEQLDIISGEPVSLVFVKHLGSGAFGRVDHLELRRNSFGKRRPSPGPEYVPVAVKSPLGPEGELLIRKEGEILRELKNADGVVRLEAVVPDGHGGQSLVEELLEGPSLQELLDRQKKCLGRKKLYTHQQAAKWMLQLASALDYMHSMPNGRTLVHRDVSIANVMLDSYKFEKANLKLIDFGIACALSEIGGCCKQDEQDHDFSGVSPQAHQMSSSDFYMQTDAMSMKARNTICGSFLHMAPEVVTSENYNEKVDIFSFGMVMFQIFHHTSMITVLHHSGFTIKDGQAAIVGGWRPPLNHSCPPCIRRLIERCWSTNPELRPSSADVVAELTLYLSKTPKENLKSPGLMKRFAHSFKGLSLSAMKNKPPLGRGSSSRSLPEEAPSGSIEEGTSSTPHNDNVNGDVDTVDMEFDTVSGIYACRSQHTRPPLDPHRRLPRRSNSTPGTLGRHRFSTGSNFEEHRKMFEEVAQSMTPPEATRKIAQPMRRTQDDTGARDARNNFGATALSPRRSLPQRCASERVLYKSRSNPENRQNSPDHCG